MNIKYVSEVIDQCEEINEEDFETDFYDEIITKEGVIKSEK